MDGELNPPSLNNSEERISHTEIFNQNFPFYLSIGMTYDEYWNKDCMLVRSYRKAHTLKEERDNTNAWLSGLYIYEALLRASPMFLSFAPKGTKPLPYLDEPYAINEEMAKIKKEKERESERKKAKEMMEIFMLNTNKKFE